MINDIEQPNNPRNGKALAGMILLAVGAVLLLQRLFSTNIDLWPLWLIAAGLFIGAKSNFRKPSSFALLLIGCALLITTNIHGANNVIWPLAIISFGLWMILKRHNKFDTDFLNKKQTDKWDWKNHTGLNPNEPVVDYTQNTSTGIPPAGSPPPSSFSSNSRPVGDEYLDTVSVFGNVKKVILSKDFKGGEIINIFGGAALDFTQADINGRVVIDITQIFGSTKIIIPSHWQVVSDIAAVFGGIEDKRIRSTAAIGNEKILVLTGVSIFAGVDIRSY